MFTAICFAAVVAASPPQETAQVHVQTNPPGATIQIQQGERRFSTRQKTPTMVTVPAGEVSLILTVRGYEKHIHELQLQPGEALALDPIALVPEGRDVEVDCAPDWIILVDGKPAQPTCAGLSILKGVVRVPCGRHRISVVKYGYADRSKSITVSKKGEDSKVEFPGDPKKGQSLTLAKTPWLMILGKWKRPDQGRILTFNADGTGTVTGKKLNRASQWTPKSKSQVALSVKSGGQFRLVKFTWNVITGQETSGKKFVLIRVSADQDRK